MKNNGRTPVAVFDFDGTIISGDSFLPFMRYVVGGWKYYCGMPFLLPWLGSYAFGVIDNRRIKEKVIGYFLKGKPARDIRELGESYAESFLHTKEKPKMMAKIDEHVKESHILLLASASLLVYLKPWAEINHFDGVCGAQLEVDGEERITGRICGNNGFGQEKLDAVTEWLAERNPDKTYAYGDSQGDKELLDWADVKTFKGRLLSIDE